MHPLVQARFRHWITGKGAVGEGEVKYMYKDSKGLVTIGVGNPIDPLEKHPTWAKPSNYKNKLKKSVKQNDVLTDFKTVKNVKHWTGHGDFRAITMLRLTDKALSDLFNRKMKSLETNLKVKHAYWFGKFDLWPADAQMALLGLAWGFGAGGVATKFRKFSKACKGMDFTTAAIECHYKGKSKSARHRNADLKKLFNNAAYTLYEKKPLHVLIFPDTKQAPTGWKPGAPR